MRVRDSEALRGSSARALEKVMQAPWGLPSGAFVYIARLPRVAYRREAPARDAWKRWLSPGAGARRAMAQL